MRKMSYGSDTDLPSLRKGNHIDTLVSYELSSHFNDKLHLNKSADQNGNVTNSNKKKNGNIKKQMQYDINDNFHTKAFKSNDDIYLSMHRGKSGTWP
jgi:hypothetical protein